ncbi:MAG: hypothetical protein P4L33_18870 [Capsulimonadaceae bacterium]|nr:hypothetical protein [Capsulimonadaceae bacterium]
MVFRIGPIYLARNRNQPALTFAAAPTRWALGFMGLLSVAFVALAVCCNLISPLSYSVSGRAHDSNADEEAQVGNVARIASGHLPVFRAGDPDYEAHQPPLYYALTAPLAIAARSLPAESATKILRAPSIVFGLLLIWAAYLAVRTAIPASEALAVGAAGFVALLPMNLSLAASVTNDVLTNLIFALALWRIACIARRAGVGDLHEHWRREAIWLGVLMGAGIWTKTSSLLLFPVTVFVLLMLANWKVASGRLLAKTGALAVCAGLIIGLPWMIRNTLLYGDPVAQHIFVTAFQNTATTKDMMSGKLTGGVELSVATYWTLDTLWTFESFWFPRGIMGDSVVHAAGILSFLAMIGAVIAALSGWRKLGSWQHALLGGFAALILLNLAVFVRFNTTFFQAQGRYLYPALVPIAALLLGGISGLAPQRWRGVVIGICIAVLFVADISMLLHLSQAYSNVSQGMGDGYAGRPG